MSKGGTKSRPAVGTSEAISALEHLGDLLREGADIDRIFDGYLETRSLLSRTFRELAKSRVGGYHEELIATRAAISEYMNARFSKLLPASLLGVRPYGETHALLFSYLKQRAGSLVPGTRLRLITGDQVHTERRVRELRDLGYTIDAGVLSRKSAYVLKDAAPDVEAAALLQARANIKGSKNLSGSRKRELLDALEV